MKHVFQIIIEKDEAGYYVAECPALRGCYTQAKTYEEVIENIKDVIALCLEDFNEPVQGAGSGAESSPLRCDLFGGVADALQEFVGVVVAATEESLADSDDTTLSVPGVGAP